MELQRLEQLKTELGKASPAQVLDLQDVIRTIISQQTAGIALERRTQACIQTKTCPHCHGGNLVVHGKDRRERSFSNLLLGRNRPPDHDTL